MQRFIPPCLALAVLLAAAAFAFDPTAPTAHACSIVTPNDARFADTVDRSPIVAIGHWEDSKERTVTFVVDQPLKGAGEGERLQVDNRTTYTAMACSPYDEPFRESAPITGLIADGWPAASRSWSCCRCPRCACCSGRVPAAGRSH